jgi:MFS family permease
MLDVFCLAVGHSFIYLWNTEFYANLVSIAATGYASNFGPVYNAEISPAELRGIMISLYQTMLGVGGLLGSAINTGTSTLTTRWAYRIPLLTQMVFPVILATLIWLFPESPRKLPARPIPIRRLNSIHWPFPGWLISVNKPEAASQSLRRLRGRLYPEERISREIEIIAAYVELEKHAAKSSSVRDAFRGTDRRRTHIACGLLFFQAFSGTTFISV